MSWGRSGSSVGAGDSKRVSSKGAGDTSRGSKVGMGIAETKGSKVGSGDSKGSKLGSGAEGVKAEAEEARATTAAEQRRENRKDTILVSAVKAGG